MPAIWVERMRKAGVPALLPERLEGYWRRDAAEVGGGAFADAGSHFVSLGLWLGGAPAAEVAAFSEPKGRRQERAMTASGRLGNHVVVSVTGSNAADMGSQLTVIGDKGVLTGQWSGYQGDLELWLQLGKEREKVVSGYEDQSPISGLIATLLDGAPNLSPARDAAHVVEFTEAAYRSALEERVVRIEPRDASGPVSSEVRVQVPQ